MQTNSVTTGMSNMTFSTTSTVTKSGGVAIPSTVSSTRGNPWDGPSNPNSRANSASTGAPSSRQSVSGTSGGASIANSSATSTLSTNNVRTFNKDAYGHPGARSTTGSVASGSTDRWAKVKAVPKVIERVESDVDDVHVSSDDE